MRAARQKPALFAGMTVAIVSTISAQRGPLVASPPRFESPTIEELRATYQALDERDREASRLVVHLDRNAIAHAAAAAARHRDATDLRRKAMELKNGSDELLNVDTSINADLQKLYAGATALDTPESGELLVRTALLHWAVRLRQAS